MQNNPPAPIIPPTQAPIPPTQNTSVTNPLNQAPVDTSISPSINTGGFDPTGPNSSVPPANVTTIESKKGGKGFGIFVVLGIIVIICIYGYVGFLYLQNQKLKNSSSNGGSKETAKVEATPTPEFDKDFVKVSSGNVVYDDGTGNTKVLVDKNNVKGTGITGFIKVSVSPDESKMCFETWPPAPSPALYYANTDGSSVTQVSEKRKNCLWTADSKKLLYVNISTPVISSNIYLYDLGTKEEKNLTLPDPTVTATKNYELVGLSADGSKAICKYEAIGKTDSGQCEIDLSTFAINYL